MWLARLASSRTEEPLTPLNPEQYDRVVAAVGPGAIPWAVNVGDIVAHRLLASMSLWERSDDGFRVLRSGTIATTMQLLLTLASPQNTSAASPESLASARDLARRQITAEEMLRAIQLGHATMAEFFFSAAGTYADAAQSAGELSRLSERMFAFFDQFAMEMMHHFHEVQKNSRRDDTAAQFALVRRLLSRSGDVDEHDRRALGYRLNSTHQALVAWSTANNDTDVLTGVAHSALRSAGYIDRLVIPAGPASVWAWAHPPGSGPTAWAAAAKAISAPSHVRIALGGPGSGIAGFRGSHEEARVTAAMVTNAPGRFPAVVDYADIAVMSLVMADPGRALRFARRELRGLAGDTVRTRELRATLAAYLDEGRRPTAAAQRLNVSRNTVTYRVNRAEELIGSLSDVNLMRVRVALLILDEE